MNSGWLNIDKPYGYSSAKVVAIVKSILGAKKVGHGGTLDPLATGVLPISVNNATKQTNLVMASIKEYVFHVTFGEERDTDDAEGEVVETCDIIPTEAEIKVALPTFTGRITQVPPVYSAIKIKGRRACDIVRAGGEVELEPREVEIMSLKLNGFAAPDTIELVAECGKGFYIRSLARDLGRHLGSCAYVSQLRRTRVGGFNQDNIITPDELRELVNNSRDIPWVPVSGGV